MNSTGTITIKSRDKDVTIPAGTTYEERRYGKPERDCTGDVRFIGTIATGIGVAVEIRLGGDGEWVHSKTLYGNYDNPYLHFVADFMAEKSPSEAQIATIAKWYLDPTTKPYGMFPGADVCSWAFRGSSPDEVSRRFGDGKPVVLSGQA